MHFMLVAKDKADALQTRLDTRAAHIDYVRASGVVAAGGPLLDDAGEMIGSMLILDVADRAAAEEFAAGDPYAQAGVFESVEITGWNWVIGNPNA